MRFGRARPDGAARSHCRWIARMAVVFLDRLLDTGRPADPVLVLPACTVPIAAVGSL